MITIFWDLDNVLCDYDIYWGSDKTFDRNRFKSEVIDNKMFEKLLPLSAGIDLLWGVYDYLQVNKIEYNFQILSSLGAPNDNELAEEVSRQKELWINYHLRDYVGSYVLNLNFVEQKSKKKRFATPTSILIDDTQKNVLDFVKCHGQGILFNANTEYYTILKEVCDTIDLVYDKIERKIY